MSLSRKVYTPTTLAELQLLLPKHPSIRPFATANPATVLPAQVFVSMKHFTRPLSLTEGSVTVEAGMSLTSLFSFLASNGRTLSSPPSNLSSTVGGAIATGAHGAGPLTLAAQVKEAVFVTSTGSLVKIDANSSVLVSAGTAGVMYSVTLNTVPAFTLYQQRIVTRLPLDCMGWLKGGMYRSFIYNPYTQRALLSSCSLTCDFGEDYKHIVGKVLTRDRGEKVSKGVYENTPVLIPRCIDSLLQAEVGVSSGPVEKVLEGISAQPSYFEYEVAVPFAQAVTALAAITGLVEKWKEEERYYIGNGVGVRYLSASPFPLSLSYGVDVVSFSFSLYNEDDSYSFIEEVQGVVKSNRFCTGKYIPSTLLSHSGWNVFDEERRRMDAEGRFIPVAK